jgi:DNA mismatch endonuclease (patch repair protein)
MPGLRCRPDVVFSKARVAVFVDGCFWHRCPQHLTDPRTNSTYWAAKLDRNVARDRRNDAALEAAGWHVIRVWEHESPSGAADRVEAALRKTHLAVGRTP